VALERFGRKLELAPTPASISFAAPVLTRAKIDAIIEETATATATKVGRAVTERRKPALQTQPIGSCAMMRRERRVTAIYAVITGRRGPGRATVRMTEETFMKRGRNDQSVLFGGIAPNLDPVRLKEAWLQIDRPIEIIERRMPIGAELAVLWAPFHARRWRPISASGAPWRPSEAKQAAACEIARILGEMSRFMPLDIRPRAGVIEGLELRIGGGAITLVEPRNTVGHREVCAFTNIDARGAAAGWPHLEGWCAGRVRAAQVGAKPDDSWSAGMLRRVLRPYGSRGVQCLVHRFRGSNHIRRRGRVCRSMCGRRDGD
jgi:hypothetical protein